MTELEVLKQHKDILKGAMLELAFNNTNSLVEDDIIKGFVDVPLETMDILKQRIINIAKNNNLVLDNHKFNEILIDYKISLKKEIRNIFEGRIKIIKDSYSKLDDNKPLDLVKNLKKDLVKFNKEVKKNCKTTFSFLVKEKIVDKLDTIVDDINFKKDVTKFLQSVYVKQMIETLDMKILVKDTILINSLKEQIERFVFTKENSHLFD